MAGSWGTSWGTSWATSWGTGSAPADPYLNYYNSRKGRTHDHIAKRKTMRKDKGKR